MMKDSEDKKGIPRKLETGLAVAGLILLFPFLLMLAGVVRTTSHGTVLFRQKRVGRGGREFTLYKFRTMRGDAGGLKLTSANDARLTRAGKWLRHYKLDELPQLWNVVRGDMSLVGPRPEVAEYVDLDEPLWQEILSVRPGITDPVALRLRNEERLLASVGDREAFYTDILQPYKIRGWADYVRNRSFKTDVLTIFQTFKAIIQPATAPPPSVDELLTTNF